jgi:hypothetical protein
VGQELALEGASGNVRETYFWFPAAGGSFLRVRGNGFRATVPHGTMSGLARVEMRNDEGFTAMSEPFAVTVLPQLRLRSSRLRVASGETVQITATSPDVAGTWPLVWRADFGTVDSKGQYTAPTVDRPVFARVWGCIQSTDECGSSVLKVLPFRLEPDPFILDPGEKTTLKASQGGRVVPATWQALTPNVTVAPDGTVIAGSGPFDGGKAVVSCAAGNTTERFEISIRSPGVVAHTAEYNDWLWVDNNNHFGRVALGAFAGSAAVKGDWIYALYWTGYGFGAQGRSTTRHLFEVVDLSKRPFRTVATFDRPGDQVGWAVELNGRHAYVGTDSELIVYDFTSPSKPVEVRALSRRRSVTRLARPEWDRPRPRGLPG